MPLCVPFGDCSAGSQLTPTLRNYLPDRTPIYAAPFGALSVLPKECIQIGCAPKGIHRPYLKVEYLKLKALPMCILTGAALIWCASQLLVQHPAEAASQ